MNETEERARRIQAERIAANPQGSKPLHAMMGGGLVALILMSAGCAGRTPPAPDVATAPPRVVADNPPSALVVPDDGGGFEYMQADQAKRMPQPGNGPSWTHDLATAGLAVGGVELGRYALSGAKTGAAATTGGAAARGLLAAPEAAAPAVGEAGGWRCGSRRRGGVGRVGGMGHLARRGMHFCVLPVAP